MTDLNALSLIALLQQARSVVQTTSILQINSGLSYRSFQKCYKPMPGQYALLFPDAICKRFGGRTM